MQFSKQSKVYKMAMELTEINAALEKFDTKIVDLEMEYLRSFKNQNSMKEPLSFECSENKEETCARIRPLLKNIRRPLVEVDLMSRPSTSSNQNDHPVLSLAAIHFGINGDYSLYNDIRPEIFIQEEMARRGYRHCNDHL